MKLAIMTGSDRGLKAKVDSRFGRAPYIIIVDTETMETRVINNSATNADSGAGVSAAQILLDEGVEGVIAGNFGPKAFDTLKTGNLEVYSVTNITVEEAINEIKKGTLEELSKPTKSAHSGLNQ